LIDAGGANLVDDGDDVTVLGASIALDVNVLSRRVEMRSLIRPVRSALAVSVFPRKI